MADSEATVPAEEQAVEQTPDGEEVVPQDTQQGDESVENAAQQESNEGAAATNGEDASAASGEATVEAGDGEGEGAAATEEQAASEEPAATETAEPEIQQESEPQQEPEPEVLAEPEAESKTEEQQEAEQEESKVEEAPTVELSDEEKAKCRNLFDRKAVDGRLDLKGFKILFRLSGQVLSSEDADAMFKEVNSTENGGTIDFDEFCVLYSKFCVGEQTRKEDLMNSINKLFPNSDGEPVRLKRVEGILMKLQQPDLDMRLVREKSTLNPSDIKSLVRSMDKRGDGCISKEELVETLTRHLDTM